MPRHLKTSTSFQQTDSRSKYSPYLDVKTAAAAAYEWVPANLTQGCLSYFREGGGVLALWLQVPGNLSALHIPQYRSCDPNRVSGACPERLEELCVFSHFSPSIHFIYLFIYFSCSFAYELLISLSAWFVFSIMHLGPSPPHTLYLCRECLLLVATKNPFVGSMISLAVTTGPRGPSTSHWNSTREAPLPGTPTWPTMRLWVCVC